MLNPCLLPCKQKKSGRKPRKRLLQYDNAEILNKQTSQITTTHTALQLLGTDDDRAHLTFSFLISISRFLPIFLTSQNFNLENEHVETEDCIWA